jgi:hypothetical protein
MTNWQKAALKRDRDVKALMELATLIDPAQTNLDEIKRLLVEARGGYGSKR